MAQLSNLIVNGVSRMLSKLYVSDSVTAPNFIGKLTGNADTSTKTTGVIDYGATDKTIQIGFTGSGLSGDAIKYIAGYTSGNGTDVSGKIKNISKDSLKSWLGLGSAAYTASTAYASSSHTHGTATTSAAGLMSSTDKKKLDSVDMANTCMYDGTSTDISEMQSTCDYIDGGAY